MNNKRTKDIHITCLAINAIGFAGTAKLYTCRRLVYEVQDVCNAGSTEVKYTEGGGFMGGVAGGGIASIVLGIATTVAICAAVGVPTAGAGLLVCGLVVVGVGSWAVGALAGMGGEKIGERIYQATQ